MMLVQEPLAGDPWAVGVASVMLQVTSHRQVRPVLERFLARWPRPGGFDPEEAREMLRPLGLISRRLSAISALERWILDGMVGRPRGCGRYVMDAIAIFVGGDLSVEPTDIKLRAYVAWARSRPALAVGEDASDAGAQG